MNKKKNIIITKIKNISKKYFNTKVIKAFLISNLEILIAEDFALSKKKLFIFEILISLKP